MSFHLHKDSIKNIQEVLRDASSHNHLYGHAHHVLVYISDNAEEFAQEIWVESPFFDEFFECLQQKHINDDVCFALLECLIIFCREKQLRNSAHYEACAHVQALLQDFECSELWAEEDNTLLHKWYWHELPRICKQ